MGEWLRVEVSTDVVFEKACNEGSLHAFSVLVIGFLNGQISEFEVS